MKSIQPSVAESTAVHQTLAKPTSAVPTVTTVAQPAPTRSSFAEPISTQPIYVPSILPQLPASFKPYFPHRTSGLSASVGQPAVIPLERDSTDFEVISDKTTAHKEMFANLRGYVSDASRKVAEENMIFGTLDADLADGERVVAMLRERFGKGMKNLEKAVEIEEAMREALRVAEEAGPMFLM